MTDLTEAQRLVLDYLARTKDGAPPTGAQISIDLGRDPYWATPKISSLRKRGLVERLGVSPVKGHRYGITPAGFEALAETRRMLEVQREALRGRH